jgi:hypothetical protein
MQRAVEAGLGSRELALAFRIQGSLPHTSLPSLYSEQYTTFWPCPSLYPLYPKSVPHVK